MKIEAKTLDEALLEASKKLNCSVADLEYEVIQSPSNGLLGFFKKNAIIEVKEDVVRDISDVIQDLRKSLKNLFEKGCFEIEVVEISQFNEDTIYIKLDGNDAALLIGKEGFRYNSLNYMLYHYVFQKFGYKIRLEVAQFLEKQEEALKGFLAPFIERVKEKGYGKTKPLNGILVYLALEILRKEFPEKYVAIRGDKEKYVVIGERHDNSGNSDA